MTSIQEKQWPLVSEAVLSFSAFQGFLQQKNTYFSWGGIKINLIWAIFQIRILAGFVPQLVDLAKKSGDKKCWWKNASQKHHHLFSRVDVRRNVESWANGFRLGICQCVVLYCLTCWHDDISTWINLMMAGLSRLAAAWVLKTIASFHLGIQLILAFTNSATHKTVLLIAPADCFF